MTINDGHSDVGLGALVYLWDSFICVYIQFRKIVNSASFEIVFNVIKVRCTDDTTSCVWEYERNMPFRTSEPTQKNGENVKVWTKLK